MHFLSFVRNSVLCLTTWADLKQKLHGKNSVEQLGFKSKPNFMGSLPFFGPYTLQKKHRHLTEKNKYICEISQQPSFLNPSASLSSSHFSFFMDNRNEERRKITSVLKQSFRGAAYQLRPHGVAWMRGGTDGNLTSVYDTCAVINVCEGRGRGRGAGLASGSLSGCSVSGGYNANGRQNQLPGQLCLEISNIADSCKTFMWRLGKTVQREHGGVFHYLAYFLTLVFHALFPPCSHSICCICFSLPLFPSLPRSTPHSSWWGWRRYSLLSSTLWNSCDESWKATENFTGCSAYSALL